MNQDASDSPTPLTHTLGVGRPSLAAPQAALQVDRMPLNSLPVTFVLLHKSYWWKPELVSGAGSEAKRARASPGIMQHAGKA